MTGTLHFRPRYVGIAVLLIVASLSVGSGATARGSTVSTSDSTIRLRALFRDEIRSLAVRTAIPVLLPPTLPWRGAVPRLYLTVQAATPRWRVSVAAAPGCRNATACVVASFEGVRATALSRTPNLRLPGGQPAVYTPIRCGASCGPATLAFLHRGIVVTWRLKEPPRGGPAALARLAAASIAVGSR